MEVNRRFRAQHGVISTAQAHEAGLSARQIEYRVASGAWVRVRTGVFRSTSVPTSWEGKLFSATLNRRALVSHRAAASLHGLGVFTNPRPEITVAGGFRRIDGVIVHRSKHWNERDPVQRRGIPCTGIERTLLDCAAVCRPEVTERLVEAGIRMDLTSWSRLEATRRRHAGSGRNGVGHLGSLIDRRRSTPGVTRSDFSLLVRDLLLRAGVEQPTLEYAVTDSDGRHLLALDLAWPARRKAWELDGLEWHFSRSDVERDKRIRNLVKAEGWAVQEITWSDFRSRAHELPDLARRFLAN